MIAEKMKPYLKNNSAIRMMFEEGKRLAAQYGPENVYDFSLGNPNVPAPTKLKDAIVDILNEVDPVVVHGYMSNAGFPQVRKTIADRSEHALRYCLYREQSDHDSRCGKCIERMPEDPRESG